jgi:hypothetical protein
MQNQSSYFTAYHNLKLTRDDQGVLDSPIHAPATVAGPTLAEEIFKGRPH